MVSTCGKFQAMNPREFKFVIEYCKDPDETPNGAKAAIAAGYPEESAATTAWKLLKRDHVIKAIEEHRENISIAAAITPASVLKRWWEIANANPAELIQVRRVNCRYCNGFNHNYQWTEAEYAAAVTRSINAQCPAPEGSGGFDFNAEGPVSPSCPECSGQGVEIIHLADTRTLSKSAARLYAGVRKTAKGVEVLMHDQSAALTNVARFLGMFVERKEISGPDGGPIPTMQEIKLSDLTDEQLIKLAQNAPTDDK